MLSLGAMVGYLLSRSVGLPQLADHVGQWADPAGVAALTFEAAIVVLASGEVSRVPGDRMAPAAFSLALGVLGLAAVGAGGATHPPEAGGHAPWSVPMARAATPPEQWATTARILPAGIPRPASSRPRSRRARGRPPVS